MLAAGAERQANSHLLAPCSSARQQQVGYVAARDEQHTADRPEQNEKRIFDPPCPQFMNRCYLYSDVFVGVGILRLQASGYGLDLRLRALQCLVVFDRSDNVEVAIGASAHLARIACERGP